MKPPREPQAKDQTQRLEKLLVMGRRLMAAIDGDIDALNKGAFDRLHTTDPEITALASLYAREVAALKKEGGIGKGAPAALLAEMKTLGKRMKLSLTRHERLLMCMRQASEGVVQAVANEVEKARARTTPYRVGPQARQAQGAAAILYNKVV
jgi:hypothetical protein